MPFGRQKRPEGGRRRDVIWHTFKVNVAHLGSRHSSLFMQMPIVSCQQLVYWHDGVKAKSDRPDGSIQGKSGPKTLIPFEHST